MKPCSGRICILLLLFIVCNAAICPAENTCSLDPLKKYASLPPYGDNNFKIFDTKEFLACFKKTADKRIVNDFMGAKKDGGRYFQMTGYKNTNGVLAIDMQNLTDPSFYAAFYFDFNKNELGVCWNSFNGDSGDATTVFSLANGKRVTLATPEADQCSDIDYTRIVDPIRNATLSKDEEKKLLGSWSGVGDETMSGQSVSATMQIKENPATHTLAFRQTRILKTKKGVYKCNNKNTITQDIDGEVTIDYGKPLFIEKAVSNPKCGSLSKYTMSFDGNKLNAMINMQLVKFQKQ